MRLQGTYLSLGKSASDPTLTFLGSLDLSLSHTFLLAEEIGQTNCLSFCICMKMSKVTSHPTVLQEWKTKETTFLYNHDWRHMQSLYWKDNMYSLTVLFWAHILIFLKASVNVKRILVLYFCAVKIEEKGKPTYLWNATWSSVLLIKLNEQHLQVFTYFPPWTSLETYEKNLFWDAKPSWK